MAESGFLVCADITGYTQYLSKSELEHASGILQDLLQLLLGQTRAPLRLSRVEGDAVISYAEAMDGVDPQVLVDRLENTYLAFRRALDQMIQNTSCSCNACANIATLDLKFVVHHGQFLVQHLGVQDELVGPEVNFMFRQVKNHVKAELGVPGYIAFTDAAVAAIGLPGYAATLIDHTEEDQERGPITLHVRDMGPVWERRRHERMVELPDVMVERSEMIAAPIEVVWSYLARPETRVIAMAADGMDPRPLDDGRMGREAVYVCYHGEASITQTILDWDPPFRAVWSSFLPDGLGVIIESLLQAVDDGSTEVTARSSSPQGPKRAAKKNRKMAEGLVKGSLDAVYCSLHAMAAELTGAG
jgi:hypothetical protein